MMSGEGVDFSHERGRNRLSNYANSNSAIRVTRRRALTLIGFGVAGVYLAACRGDDEPDFSDRFAEYEPASEANGDPTKVDWPDFVVQAGPEVQRLYEFQIENGDLMRYMPCFCGCGNHAGHRSNRDCYVKQVNPDGSVVLDSMAPT